LQVVVVQRRYSRAIREIKHVGVEILAKEIRDRLED
jgi:hypothetical protein